MLVVVKLLDIQSIALVSVTSYVELQDRSFVVIHIAVVRS